MRATAGFVLLMLLGLLVALDWPARVHERAVDPAETTAEATAEARTRVTRRPPTVALAASRPASLVDTDVDGALRLGADGALVADAEVLRLFDYFLATLGETTLAGVHDLVRAEAARQLPGREDEVLALLDRYLAYLGAVERAAAEAGPGATPRSHLERTVELQRAAFGEPDAARLFGDANALARAILDESELRSRDDLSPAALASALAAVEADLPPRLREARRQRRAPAESRAEVEALRRQAAGEAAVWAARAARFGAAAADRLAALDRQRGR